MKVFKNLSEVEALVEQELGVSKWQRISQFQIWGFGLFTGDHQWIHIDPSRAAEESPFKATIAHGYFTLSLYPKLRGLVDPSTPVFPGTKNIINYGINKLRFPGPVISGSSIRANCTLVSVEEVKGSIELIEEYSVEVKDQDRPACVAECIMRLYF